jgi:hypothetical protein
MTNEMSVNLTNDEIKAILERHEKVKEYRRVYYNKKYHEDEKFRESQIEYSKTHCGKYYEKNKDKIRRKRIFRYYNQRGRLDDMYKKYPEFRPDNYNSIEEEQ